MASLEAQKAIEASVASLGNRTEFPMCAPCINLSPSDATDVLSFTRTRDPMGTVEPFGSARVNTEAGKMLYNSMEMEIGLPQEAVIVAPD